MLKKCGWEERIGRARDLARSTAHAREIVAFYAEVLAWQHEVFKCIGSNTQVQRLTGALSVDQPVVMSYFGSLLDLACRHGSEALASEARELRTGAATWKELLTSCWNGEPEGAGSFFARACLQPYLELLADRQTPPFDSALIETRAEGGNSAVGPRRLCPFCGRKPQLALLSDEALSPGSLEGAAEGGRRFLMCGDCLTAWPFQRIACASCGESDPQRLPYYSTPEQPHLRVECCDSCRRYIKCFDLTRDRRPVPVVDELATISIDLWANGQGYTKLRPNLAGM